ncbi:hypothetical protein [Streptomyces macrosporus]|uniref:Uncharacterized protein n=1 Tax=Streptomyces macrosporus TaxID=44032 RepID=A0ABN3J4C3_9ACTN
MEFHGGASLPPEEYREFAERQRRHAAEHGFCPWTVPDGGGEPAGFTGARHVVAMVEEGDERSIAVTRRPGMRRAETYAVPTPNPTSKSAGLRFRLDL